MNSKFAITLFWKKNMGGQKIGDGNKKMVKRFFFFKFWDVIIQGRRGREAYN